MSKGGKKTVVNTQEVQDFLSSQFGYNAQTGTFDQSGSSTNFGGFNQGGTTSQSDRFSQAGNTNQIGNTANTSASGVDAASQNYINRLRSLATGQVDGILAPQTGTDWRSDPRVQQYIQSSGVNAADIGFNNLPDDLRRDIEANGARLPTLSLSPDMVQQFVNPALEGVVDATRGEFDHLRGQAGMQTNQAATMANAFGGSRHGVAQGVRMGELDRAQTSTIAGLRQNAYETAIAQALDTSRFNIGLGEQRRLEPLMRSQAAVSLMNLGMGPTGMVNTSAGTNALSGTNASTGLSSGYGSSTGYGTNYGGSTNTSSGSSSQFGTNYGTSSGRTSATGQQTTQESGFDWGEILGSALGLGLTAWGLYQGGQGGQQPSANTLGSSSFYGGRRLY